MLGFGLNLSLKNNVGGFNLKSISSLLHWYSFNTGQTIDSSGSSPLLTQWNDQEGSNNLTQSDATKQPVINNGELDFTDFRDQLFFGSDVSLTDFTICLVVSTDFGVDTILGNLSSNSVLLRFGQSNENDKVRLQFDVTDGSHGIQAFDLEADSDFSQDTKMVFTLTRDVSSNTVKMFENTTQKFSANLVTAGGVSAGNSPFVFDKIGSHGAAQTNPFSDKLYEVVIFNSALSGSDFTNVIENIKSRNSIS